MILHITTIMVQLFLYYASQLLWTIMLHSFVFQQLVADVREAVTIGPARLNNNTSTKERDWEISRQVLIEPPSLIIVRFFYSLLSGRLT